MSTDSPSTTDRLAEIRRQLEMAKMATTNAPELFWGRFVETAEFLLAENARLQERLDTAEGQLATAREELAARPKPRPRATVRVSLTTCTWCLEDRREMSEWEQKNLRGFWKRLCKPCARKRLNNGYNALLGMRKVDEEPSDV